MKRLTFFFFELILVFTAVFCQNGNIVRGTVVDAFTGAPLIGANVVIKEITPLKAAATNSEGIFVIENVPLGRFSFVASYMGYYSQNQQNVMVVSGKETVLNFSLEEKVNMLNDVVIKPMLNKEKPLNENALISARSFSVEETERYAGSLGDPARMAANFAGISQSNDSRNDIIIRGNSPMGLLWRVNGIEVTNPNHFGAQGTTGGPVSMLNNNLLKNSDFLTSAFPSEFGNALSGVFDINLRTGNNEKYEFTGQVGFNGFEAAAEGAIPLGKNRKGSFIADFRYSTLELMNDIGLYGKGSSLGTAIPQYKDFTFVADLPTRIGKFSITQLWGSSFISMGRHFEIEESSNYNQIGFATDFGALLNVSALSHKLYFSENTSVKSTFSYQVSKNTLKLDTINYDNKTYFNQYGKDEKEEKISATMQLKHKFSSKDNITAGFIYDHYITNFNDSAYNKMYRKRLYLNQEENQQSNLYKTYLNWQHKFSDRLMINVGIFDQYYDLSQENSPEPRFGLQWNVASKHAFSIGYGMHSQTQPRTTYFEKSYNHTTKTYEQNNLHMKFTQSHHFVIGYDFNSGYDFRIKTELYYQHLSKVPVSKTILEYSMLNYGSGFFVPNADSLVNEGSGKNYGMELTVEKFMSKGFYGLFTVSVFNSLYKGYDNVWRNSAFNNNFVLNLLAGYEWKIGKKNYLTVDGRVTYAGGMRYVPIDLNISIANSEERYDWKHAYEKRHKDYFRSDIRIGFKQNFKKVTQEFALDLQNVTNYKNVFNESFNPYTQEISTVYQQGFMPMMLYRIIF